MDARPGHEFQPPSAESSRSPCPALNAAANHHYLPHSGKNLTFLQLTRGIRELYGLSYPMAIMLSLGGIVVCGSRGKLDLEQLAVHGKVEHDASLVHEDFREGDNKNVNPRLVEELIAQSSDGQRLTMEDFARARVRREARPSVHLNKFYTMLALGESLLALMVMGHGKAIPCEEAKIWFGEERLPPGWMPQGKLGVMKLFGLLPAFGRMVNQAKRSE